MMTICRLFVAATLVVGASLSVGCDSNSGKSPSSQNSAPVGEQSVGKGKGRTMPAPPPIEKVN